MLDPEDSGHGTSRIAHHRDSLNISKLRMRRGRDDEQPTVFRVPITIIETPEANSNDSMDSWVQSSNSEASEEERRNESAEMEETIRKVDKLVELIERSPKRHSVHDIDNQGEQWSGKQRYDWESSIKKPDNYKEGSNFRPFKTTFMNYARLKHIPLKENIPTMITYLYPKLAEKCVNRLTKKEMENPNLAFPKIIEFIEGSRSSLVDSLVLSKMSQQRGESMNKFADRIRVQSLECKFEGDSSLSRVRLDVFLKGMLDKVILTEILTVYPPISEFDKAVEIANRIEGARLAVNNLREEVVDPVPIFGVTSKQAEDDLSLMIKDKDDEIARLTSIIDNLMSSGDYTGYDLCGVGHLAKHCELNESQY